MRIFSAPTKTFTAVCAWIFVALLSGPPAQGKIVEEVVDLPVRVTDAAGATIDQPIKLTIFHDDARPRAPFLILLHGRAVSAQERANFGRARFGANARYFVQMGFAVLAPTRIGYGVSGGPDVEYSGTCRVRNYPPAYEAAAQQTIRAIEHARTLSYVDGSAGVVVGQSFGGATAIAIAAKNLQGVKAVVNFAGGGGGDPEHRPAEPCRNDLLQALFAGYGATARIPSLWLYSENDRYFGVQKPTAWFEAFRAKGGRGDFIKLPPFEPDGHLSFSGNPDAWRPDVSRFLLDAMGSALRR
ncbi:alpha/beta fold hydrolase [Terrarubrum flagellatum]|uniref:alpha/beta fold hydrolase n=1 Tax=Terrirubrum flagellatum TaxID=2895980 RepID=UPI003144FD6A